MTLEIRRFRRRGDRRGVPRSRGSCAPDSRGDFLAEVRRQAIQEYRLYGGYEDGRLVVLAGVRRSHTLSRGEHLFVDDLVTAEDARGRGHGRAMLEWLGLQAAAQGIPRIYLDSRATAKGFYERAGYTFLTSTPCWRDTASSG